MTDDRSSLSSSADRLAEPRSLLARAVADAAHSRALLMRQRQTLVAERDAIVSAGRSRAADITQTIADSQRIMTESRQTVEECTRQLKRQQVPPETVLAVVKSVARSSAHPELGLCDVQALVSEVVGWCIDAYYSAA
jgi:hypothetical protein